MNIPFDITISIPFPGPVPIRPKGQIPAPPMIMGMFERQREENIGPDVVPPRKLQTEADLIHRALFNRWEALREEHPGTALQYDLQDQEPRAILWAESDGRLIHKEFFESAFSADIHRFTEEYVRAARECGDISILYSGLGFPEDYVLRKIGQIYEHIRRSGVEGEVHVHGFLFDREGNARRIV
jgi:hypothetical protein